MSYPKEMEEAVANGAQMLDEKVPGWHKLINVDELDLSCCTACVCGQLGRQLGWALFPYMDDYPAEYGFDVTYEVGLDIEDELAQYRRLDAEWEKAIRARLELDKRPKQEEEVIACDHTSCSAPLTAEAASSR